MYHIRINIRWSINGRDHNIKPNKLYHIKEESPDYKQIALLYDSAVLSFTGTLSEGISSITMLCEEQIQHICSQEQSDMLSYLHGVADDLRPPKRLCPECIKLLSQGNSTLYMQMHNIEA